MQDTTNISKNTMSADLLKRLSESMGNHNAVNNLSNTKHISYTERKHLENRRKNIKSYRDSIIGNSYIDREDLAKTRNPKIEKPKMAEELSAIDQPLSESSNRPSTGFKEPPPRENPFM